MLAYLCCHNFEPAQKIRLIHLDDLWRYRDKFAAACSSDNLPATAAALQTAILIFIAPRSLDRAGSGMIPLSEMAASNAGIPSRLSAIFNPTGWWLHGFYGIPPGNSLLFCRLVVSMISARVRMPSQRPRISPAARQHGCNPAVFRQFQSRYRLCPQRPP